MNDRINAADGMLYYIVNKIRPDLAKRIAELSGKAGKFVGAIAKNPQVFTFLVEAGYRLISCGSDTGIIQKGSTDLYEMMNNVRNSA